MSGKYGEHKIQVAICELLHYGLPADATFWAVPNGGSRSQFTAKNGKTFSLEAKRLKDEGVKSGVSDLMILWKGRLLCLEVKTEKGRQSPAQKEWERTITECGGLYRVVRSVDDVREFLSMAIPTFKARLGQNLSQERNDIDDWFEGRSSNKLQ